MSGLFFFVLEKVPFSDCLVWLVMLGIVFVTSCNSFWVAFDKGVNSVLATGKSVRWC